MAPLLCSFAFADDDIEADGRRYCLLETKSATKGLTLIPRARELDIRPHAFFDARWANASREDVIYFLKRTRDGHFVTSLCPTAERVKLFGEALCLAESAGSW